MTIAPMPMLPPTSCDVASTDGRPGRSAPGNDFATVLDRHLPGAATEDRRPGSAVGSTAPDERADRASSEPSAIPGRGPSETLAGAAGVPAAATTMAATAGITGTATTATTSTTSTTAATRTTGTTTSTGATGSGTKSAAPEGGSATADGGIDRTGAPPASATAAPADADVRDDATAGATEAAAGSAAGQSEAAGDAAGRSASTAGSTGLDALGTGAAAATDDFAGQPAPARTAGAARTAAPSTDANGVTTASSVQAPGVNGPATGGQAAAAPAPASSPVVAQVAPTVARVVTRGDGEHRMMLRLHPADLGEIHLTVTVRGEHVDVEIAAGSAARDLLRDGSGQLRSLLDSIGRTSGQLVLRDLPTSPGALPASSGGTAADGQAASSYADTGDGRRDHPDTSDQHRRPQLFDEPLDRPLGAPRAPRVTTVPGGPALDVTV